MLVEVLLDTRIHVHYGFLTLCSAQTEDDDDSLADAWRGQVNGLVGAAVPEMLRIRTDTHTGAVDVRIELHDAEPELRDEWAEIVEVWFANWVDDLTLSAFEEFAGPVSLPPGGYQVRYAGTGRSGSERCLLQFWPAAGIDRIVRQTGPAAADNDLEGSYPKAGAKLKSAPDQVRLTFDDTIFPGVSSLRVTGPDGEVTDGGANVDGSEISARLESGLPDGRYTVSWSVRGGILGSTLLNDALTHGCAQADLGYRVTIHGLRHSIANWLKTAGVPTPDIQASLRHTDPRTTATYLHTTTQGRTQAINKHPGRPSRA